MNVHSTRSMSEGAMMCALTVVLALLNRFSGFLLESAFPWIYAFPMLIYAVRYGFRIALLPAFCACLCALFFSSWTSLFYLVSALLLGVLYGGLLHRGAPHALLFAVTFLTAAVCNLITMVLFAALFGQDVSADLAMIDQLLASMGSTGARWFDARSILLSVLLLLSFLQAICVHVGAQLLLVRLKRNVHRMKNLLQLRAPRWLGSAFLWIWLLYLLQSVIELQVDIRSLLQTLAFCALFVSIVYGALTAFAFLTLRRAGKGMVLMLYVLLFVPIINLLFALLGEVDLLFGLRRKMIRGVNHGTFGKL